MKTVVISFFLICNSCFALQDTSFFTSFYNSNTNYRFTEATKWSIRGAALGLTPGLLYSSYESLKQNGEGSFLRIGPFISGLGGVCGFVAGGILGYKSGKQIESDFKNGKNVSLRKQIFGWSFKYSSSIYATRDDEGGTTGYDRLDFTGSLFLYLPNNRCLPTLIRSDYTEQHWHNLSFYKTSEITLSLLKRVYLYRSIALSFGFGAGYSGMNEKDDGQKPYIPVYALYNIILPYKDIVFIALEARSDIYGQASLRSEVPWQDAFSYGGGLGFYVF